MATQSSIHTTHSPILSPASSHSPTLSSNDPSSRPSSVIIHNVRGAEGGVDAITARRRNSGSFKHMSSGGLVSNSPFMQRLNSGASSPTKQTSPSFKGLYDSGSRIPMAVTGSPRNTSGSRKPSGEHIAGPVKENSNPSEFNELAFASAGKSDDPSKRPSSTSPSVPFRPTRQGPSPSPALSSASTLSTTASPALGAPFKPSRPQFGVRRQLSIQDDLPRRQTSSYAALQKNGLVSHSPFSSSSPSSPRKNDIAPSPELVQVPYEIGAIAHESAPNGYYEQTSPDLNSSSFAPSSPSKMSGHLGLGARPFGVSASASAAERRVYAGAAVPPPTSPPSALSPIRRGIRGPRAMDGNGDYDDGEETEREEAYASRTLRRQPSNKTVTWAETEEVLEFEVEEERRRSMMSDASSTFSDDDRYYRNGHGSTDEEDSEDDIYAVHIGGNGSYSFEEGGSVEVHDLSHDGADSDAEESVVSTGSCAMDDMIGQIDSYIHEGESYETTDIFSPSQIPSFTDAPDLPDHSHRPRQPQSAFSNSTTSGAEEAPSEVPSSSCYDDEEPEEEHLQHAREQILARARASLTQGPTSSPGSPRPPLPSPPSSVATAPPAIPATVATAHLGPPVTSATLTKSESQYSLPDIGGVSPFIGFEDDGKASSVVTLEREQQQEVPVPTTQPLQPQVHAPSTPSSLAVPSESTPTSAAPADSPIMSGLNRPILSPPTSPALSRKASLVGSDVTTSSISWYGSSANGSLRGGTVRLGRDRLEERMKAHQALFGVAEGSPVSSFGAFPATGSPAATRSALPATSSTAATTGAGVGPFSQAMEGTQSAPSGPLPHPQAIEARPAPKARSATLSSSMLPTIAASPQRSRLAVSVGDPLTADVAEEMQSPLERLRRGMEGKGTEEEGEEGGMWRSGDSLLGVNELAKSRGRETSPAPEDEDLVEETEDEEEGAEMTRSGSGSALAERKQAIIAKRREKNGLAPPVKGKGRRRSRSTGDVDIAETVSVPMEYNHTMPELGFERRANGFAGGAFSHGVLESLDDIYNSRNRTYRVRESKNLVVVSDLAAGSRAGDIDPGRAWRKKRPSDVHAINRSFSTMSIGSQQARRTRELSGQLFVHLREVTFDNVPAPRAPVKVTASLDNGRQRVDAAVRDFGARISLKKEFELVCTENLAFSIHFSVPPAPAPPPAPSPAPTPPASPSKPSRGLRIFSSPKKRSAAPTRVPPPPPAPTPDPFYSYVSADGQLATARVTFATHAAQCRLTKSRIVVPFGQKATPSSRTCSGALVVELLFVPAVAGVPKARLPKSMDEIVDGLELAEWATKITHESVLTQLGGDCSIWRRRVVKLRGSTLVPYSEVTKRSHVEINLALVASVADLNTPSMPTPGSRASQYDEDEQIGRMDNSFRLIFKDGNQIDFFADSAEVKAKWMETLNKVVGKAENKKSPPDWAVAARKLPLPKAA
ncbi:hypothetical protein JCM11641_007809 [Rhodosporidiobolus odoratus]